MAQDKDIIFFIPQQINLSSLQMSEIWGKKIAKTRKRKTRNQEGNTECIIRENTI